MAESGKTTKSGKKNRKFGRHKRNPSCQNQAMRSERNKRRRIEREAFRQATPKQLKYPHGHARWLRRGAKPSIITTT